MDTYDFNYKEDDTGFCKELRSADDEHNEESIERVRNATQLITKINDSGKTEEEIIKKYEKRILDMNDSALSVLFCSYFDSADFEAHKKIIFESNNLKDIFEFSRITGASKYRPEIEQIILDSKDPYYIGLYHRYFKPKNTKAFSDSILETGNTLHNTEFIVLNRGRLDEYKKKGIDYKKHLDIVLDKGTGAEIFKCAEIFANNDLDKYSKAIIKSKDPVYNYKFLMKYSRRIDPSLVKQHKKVILECNSAECLSEALTHVPLTNEEYEQFENALLATKDIQRIIYTTRDIRSNISKIEEMVLESNNPIYSLKLCDIANNKKALNYQAHQDIITSAEPTEENLRVAIEFADRIVGADVKGIEDYVIASKNPQMMQQFATTVVDSDVSRIVDEILSMDNVNPRLYSALSRRADIPTKRKLTDAVIKSRDAISCYFFALNNLPYLEGKDIYKMYRITQWHWNARDVKGDSYATRFYVDIIVSYEHNLRKKYQEYKSSKQPIFHKIIKSVKMFKAGQDIEKEFERYK